MPAGDIDYRHAFLDMSSITVAASNYTRAGATCRAAMGFSFAAGTTDGEWFIAMCLNKFGWGALGQLTLGLLPFSTCHKTSQVIGRDKQGTMSLAFCCPSHAAAQNDNLLRDGCCLSQGRELLTSSRETQAGPSSGRSWGTS